LYELVYSWDDHGESVQIEVIAVLLPRVEFDGDTLADGLDVNIRFYDDRVYEESWKRMSGWEIGRENTCEPKHVVNLAVGQEGVNGSKIGCD
jgi:hypothetical protein